ncbi:MAG: nucleoside deaminase, partial [Muribaculaceae bacterium]|nr:nucleoside deaminase [Muribaculaceae bacterium]
TRVCRQDATPLHPRTQVVAGILAEEAAELMRNFFVNKR